MKHNEQLQNDIIADRELALHNIGFSSIEIFEKIETFRKNVKPIYTQKALAKDSGISLSAYKTYCNGMSDNIKLKTFLLMLDNLGIQISDILENY